VDAGIGVNALAMKLDVSGATISNVIRGKQRPGSKLTASFFSLLAWRLICRVYRRRRVSVETASR